MNQKKLITNTLIGTILSVLVFFSISFITFLTNIGPFHYYDPNEAYHLEIGFPFIYYYEFLLRGGITPNTQWNISNLFYNCLLTWGVITGLYLMTIRLLKKDK